MSDRGMIKWVPFDSVTSSKDMLRHIVKEKNRILKPILSEEQLREIEEKIWEGYHNQIPLQIVYYYKGRYQSKNGLSILEIQMNQKRIIFQDYSILYFDQILQVSF